MGRQAECFSKMVLDRKIVSDELSNALSENSCHQLSLAEQMLNSDRDLFECKWEVVNKTRLKLLAIGRLPCCAVLRELRPNQDCPH